MTIQLSRLVNGMRHTLRHLFPTLYIHNATLRWDVGHVSHENKTINCITCAWLKLLAAAPYWAPENVHQRQCIMQGRVGHPVELASCWPHPQCQGWCSLETTSRRLSRVGRMNCASKILMFLPTFMSAQFIVNKPRKHSLTGACCRAISTSQPYDSDVYNNNDDDRTWP